MKKALSLLLVLTLVSVTTAAPRPNVQDPAQPQAQSAISTQLTNRDVLEMVKAGLASDIIVAKIKSSSAKFDTTPTALAELKTAGIPDSVIMAMVQSTGEPAVAPSIAPGPEVEVKIPDGTEIEIQLRNNLSGQEAKVGDFVDFTVVRAIQVNA
ncbi:MAG: hypothetical protein ABR568_08845 [Pyrinomonadaceae bacterium]